MFPCSACHRHLRESEAACPFCGTLQRSTTGSVGSFALAGALMVGAVACGPDRVSLSETGSTSTSSASETTAAMESSSSESSTGTDTGDDPMSSESNMSLSFYAGPDDLAPVSDCDPFLQDCPLGEKCVPYANNSGGWNANKCVPILGDGAAGEACVSGGLEEGTDDCDGTSYCFNVTEVDGQMLGTCAAFCTGTQDEPECPDQQSCMIANDGVLALCIDVCDPVLQDCAAGLTCIWVGTDPHCVLVAGDGEPAGAPCPFLNSCEPGAMCLGAGFTPYEMYTEYVPDCDYDRCCVAWCSVLDVDPCLDPNLACVPFFEPGQAPLGLEHVGVCVTPPP